MLINRGRASALLACLVLSITACGGGGGGGGGGFPILGSSAGSGSAPNANTPSSGGTNTPSSGGTNTPSDNTPTVPSEPGDELITVSFEGSLDGYVMLGANYPGPTAKQIFVKLDKEPSGAVYPVVIDPQQVLDPQWNQLTATRLPDGRYSTYLMPKARAEAGEYKGALQLKLCKDPLCTNEYRVAGGDFNYKLEYLADAAMTVKLNGVVLKAFGSTSVVWGRPPVFVAATGAVMEVESNVPVKWVLKSYSTTRTIELTEQTDKRISGTLTTEGWPSGWINVTAEPLDSRYTQYPFFEVYGPASGQEPSKE